MNEPKLIVTKQKSKTWYFLMGFTAFLALLGVFFIGRVLAIKDLSSTKRELSELKSTLASTKSAYDLASESLVLEKQSTMVESLTNQDLINNIQALTLEQQSMREELRFYRNIMAPEKDAKGLNIDQLVLTKIDGATNKETANKDNGGQYHFRLTIIQAQKQAQFLKGNVEISVIGHDIKDETAMISYKFIELGSFKRSDFAFQFKYFQNIQGIIQLPRNFMPQRVMATAKTKGLPKNQTAKLETVWQPEEK